MPGRVSVKLMKLTCSEKAGAKIVGDFMTEAERQEDTIAFLG